MSVNRLQHEFSSPEITELDADRTFKCWNPFEGADDVKGSVDAAR